MKTSEAIQIAIDELSRHGYFDHIKCVDDAIEILETLQKYHSMIEQSAGKE